jgi:hypothetical protein
MSQFLPRLLVNILVNPTVPLPLITEKERKRRAELNDWMIEYENEKAYKKGDIVSYYCEFLRGRHLSGGLTDDQVKAEIEKRFG